MRPRSILALALAAITLAACEQPTAVQTDTVTITKTDTVVVKPAAPTSWQVVIQSKPYNGIWPIGSDRKNPFVGQTVDDFDYAAPSLVLKQAKGDTSYVGIATYISAFSHDFVKPSLVWTVGSDLTTVSNPASTSVIVGKASSIYEIQRWARFEVGENFAYFPDGQPAMGKPALSVIGSNFQFIDKTVFDTTKESALEMLVMFYVPVVCAEFGDRTLSSKGISYVKTDSVRTYKDKRPYDLDLKVTCNPSTAANGNIVPAPRVSLRDHVAAARASAFSKK